ncbi:MAG: RNA polymerase sigma factor [Polyangiaceae bacterium]|nr:RNA polymerase sigma factor [Myxococcales bacterium]MCB9586578.1 RNA polymerase sigma factor [Polyangiaceae bacterium]MCB9606085.1 RNA polymerase sigma factor [Polyangiaceae bacterium]
MSPPNPQPGFGSDPRECGERAIWSDLVDAARAGDSAALAELLELVRHPVRRTALMVLGRNHADAEDATQQALIAFVGALPRFRGECHPAGYASRIALRLALASRRKSQRDARNGQNLMGDELQELSPSPSELSAATRRRELLRQLLDELPDYLADTLALRTLLGYSLQEVASITDAPVNTVRSRMRLAKEALRRRIEEDPLLRSELGVGDD